MNTSKQKLLNLGCGMKIHPAWTNVDLHPKSPEVIDHDLTKGVPFADNTFDMVYHSAVLEHFTKAAGAQFLRECFRVLKPGGIIRVAIPDLEMAARAYIATCDELAQGKEVLTNHDWMVAELIDQSARQETGGEMGKILKSPDLQNEGFIFARIGEEGRVFREEHLRARGRRDTKKPSLRQKIRSFIKGMIPPRYAEIWKVGSFRLSGEVHQWMYDQYSLAAALQDIGFTRTQKQTAISSMQPDFVAFHLDAAVDGAVIKPDSLFMEAVKPNL